MTASLTKDQIEEVLKTIIDPSQQKDLVALGFVSAIHIKDSNVSIILEVPAHKGPALEPLRKKAEIFGLGDGWGDQRDGYYDRA